LRERGTRGRGAKPLALELLGLGDAAAFARHNGIRWLIEHDEHGLYRRRWMLVAIADERIDVGKRHVVAAGCDAGDRLERRGRLVHRHLQAFAFEEALVLRNEDESFRPLEPAIERELDAGLRARGRR
jgi:hypothetical protein